MVGSDIDGGVWRGVRAVEESRQTKCLLELSDFVASHTPSGMLSK